MKKYILLALITPGFMSQTASAWSLAEIRNFLFGTKKRATIFSLGVTALGATGFGINKYRSIKGSSKTGNTDTIPQTQQLNNV